MTETRSAHAPCFSYGVSASSGSYGGYVRQVGTCPAIQLLPGVAVPAQSLEPPWVVVPNYPLHKLATRPVLPPVRRPVVLDVVKAQEQHLGFTAAHALTPVVVQDGVAESAVPVGLPRSAVSAAGSTCAHILATDDALALNAASGSPRCALLAYKFSAFLAAVGASRRRLLATPALARVGPGLSPRTHIGPTLFGILDWHRPIVPGIRRTSNDSNRSRKPNDRHRGPGCAQHGKEPITGAGHLRCVLVGTPVDAGVQGRLVRPRSDRDRPLVSEQQDLLRLWPSAAVPAAERPGMGVRRMRHRPRPGRECGEERSRGRAGRECLWKWSETASLLERGGIC